MFNFVLTTHTATPSAQTACATTTATSWHLDLRDPARFDAFVGEAMPIVESFQFQ